MDRERDKQPDRLSPDIENFLQQVSQRLTEPMIDSQRIETVSFRDFDRLTQAYIVTIAASPASVLLGLTGIVAGEVFHMSEVKLIATNVLIAGVAGVILALAPAVLGDGWVVGYYNKDKESK